MLPVYGVTSLLLANVRQRKRGIMLDTTAEKPIPLNTAAGLIPPARNGKKTHLSTLLRWITRGAKSPSGERVRLEAVRLGGRWMTSKEALQRFAERLTPRLDTATEPATPRTLSQRQRAAARTERELDQIGI
jgi:hypothetical protein